MKEKFLSLFKKNIAVSSGLVFLLFLIVIGGEKVSPSSLKELFATHEARADVSGGPPGDGGPPGSCCGCDCGPGGW